MNSMKTLSIADWRNIFESFQQVERVEVNDSDEHLDVSIIGKKDIISVTVLELNKIYHGSDYFPHEVVTSILKENGVPIYYQNTLLAYFDIQAYSVFISRNKSLEAIKKINKLFAKIRMTAKTNFYSVKFDLSILSDSIILVIDTNRHPLFSCSLEFFLATCSIIMADSLKYGFPVRGAIGGGDFYKEKDIIVSSALVDAVDYEKKQNWLGAVFTPEAYRLIEMAKAREFEMNGETKIDFSSERFAPFVRHGSIPWKNEFLNQSLHYYIKPFMDENDWVKYIPSYFDDEKKLENSIPLYA